MPEIVGIVYVHLRQIPARTVREEQRRPILIDCGIGVYRKGIGLLRIRIEAESAVVVFPSPIRMVS